MELTQFKNLCKALGKSDVLEGEEWSTVKYIHTPGQGSPAVDVEYMIARNNIEFSEDPPGFIITEPQAADVMININDDTPVNTFFDLNHITDLSFCIDDDIRDIYDVVTKLNNCKLPIRFMFVVESTQKYYNYNGSTIPIYEFEDNSNIRVPFKVTKKNVTPDTDYKMSIKDISTGDKIDSITGPGEYIFTIDGTGKYYGTASAMVKVLN